MLKKCKQQISYANFVSQCELQEDEDTVTNNEADKLTEDNATSTSKLAIVRFLVVTRLHLT